MTPMILILLLKLISAIAAIRNKLKIVGYYLFGNLFLDIASQVIKHYNHYPKPYTGIGFYLFACSTFFYLSNGAWLLFCSGKSSNSKTIQQVSILSLISILILVLTAYPTLAGASLLTVFYAYYAVLSIISIVFLIKSLFNNLSLNNGIMIMLNLGCLLELFIVKVFGFHYYWLVSVCNCILYLATLVSCALVPKYRNLLKP